LRGVRAYRCHECLTRFLDRAQLANYGQPGEIMLLPTQAKSRNAVPRWTMWTR
jgi:hypothetical protein